MVDIQLFPQNVNPKAAIFVVNGDFLGPFEKMAITRDSGLIPYCPLAQAVFKKPSAITRVDLSAKNGNTHIGIVRKMLDWSPVLVDRMQELLTASLNSATPPVDLVALQRDKTPQEAFIPKGPAEIIKQAFEEAVAPILVKDGGAMEILKVTIEPQGTIVTEVALLGSCSNCTSSTEKTLKGFATVATGLLAAAKKDFPNELHVQSLKIGDIKTTEVGDFLLAKPRM